MGRRSRQSTLAIVVEELLRPYIRDPSIRKIAGFLIAFFWKAVLTTVLIVIAVVVGAVIWMAYK